ncbi:hypothetical protein C8R45DRAFT_265130 [Mycena sanguinolenta]|nr:hypothetical protein C8R45DRAFT_265130 [Mycena sanguinolenta]
MNPRKEQITLLRTICPGFSCFFLVLCSTGGIKLWRKSLKRSPFLGHDGLFAFVNLDGRPLATASCVLGRAFCVSQRFPRALRVGLKQPRPSPSSHGYHLHLVYLSGSGSLTKHLKQSIGVESAPGSSTARLSRENRAFSGGWRVFFGSWDLLAHRSRAAR